MAPLVSAMLLVASVGCSSGSKDGGPGPSTTASGSTGQAEVGATAEVVPGEATVVRSDGGVVVEVPADAASRGTLAITDDAVPPISDANAADEGELRDLGAPVAVRLDDGELDGEATISFPLDGVEAGQLPVVERLDEESGRWVPEPLEALSHDDGRVTVTVSHFSWYRPSWLSVDKVAAAVAATWRSVFGDGLSGGTPPTCPRDAATLDAFAWDSSPDDTLFWCVGTNDDDSVVLNVVNNNRYPMALDTSTGMTEIGKWGGTWFTGANVGAAFDQWGSGQVVLEAREGVTFRLDQGTSGRYELHSDFTMLTWAVSMLGVALSAYVDIWTRSGTAVDTVREKLAFSLESSRCMGEVLRTVVEDPSGFEAARAMLVEAFGCAGEVFKDAVRDYGLLARLAGTVVAFVTGPIIAAFEGLVALGEIGYDSYRRRATYDLTLAPKPGAGGASPGWDELASAEIPALCGHPPATLVDGRDVSIAPNMGEFDLLQTLPGGAPALVQDVPSNDGPLTAIVARCNQGGVGWPHLVLFFGTGGEFRSAAFADGPISADGQPDAAWADAWTEAGATWPAREGTYSIELQDGAVVIGTWAQTEGDAECCPSGEVTVRMRPNGSTVDLVDVTWAGGD